MKAKVKKFKPEVHQFACDCDSCIHRSEDMLCELSTNEEGCPLIELKKGSYNYAIELLKERKKFKEELLIMINDFEEGNMCFSCSCETHCDGADSDCGKAKLLQKIYDMIGELK